MGTGTVMVTSPLERARSMPVVGDEHGVQSARRNASSRTSARSDLPLPDGPAQQDAGAGEDDARAVDVHRRCRGLAVGAVEV